MVCSLAIAAPLATADKTPAPGRHYYSVVDKETGEVDRRGRTEGSSTAFGQMVLRPNRTYIIQIYDPITGRIATQEVTTSGPGEPFRFPDFIFGATIPFDSDGDGLPDIAEGIIGTDPTNPDTDGDGIPDGASALSDPVGGVLVSRGVVGAVDTPGEVVDVSAANNLLAVAAMDLGVLVFNVFNGMEPLIVSQVDTPGSANRVASAVGSSLIVIADGRSGVAIIDVSDPPAARVVHQVPLRMSPGPADDARCVATDGDMAIVGTAAGNVYRVDPRSGMIRHSIRLQFGAVVDVGIGGDFVYVYTSGRFTVLQTNGLELTKIADIPVPGSATSLSRLFLEDTVAYAVHRQGYVRINIVDPANPVVQDNLSTPQFGWKEIVTTGTGFGVAAMSPNSTLDGPHNVSFYDVIDRSVANGFLSEFSTPGIAYAVKIYNGLAYVADGAGGLQVVGFVNRDIFGVPPVISLQALGNNGPLMAGQRLRLLANTDDDVMVRNVEFFVNGMMVGTDGNFPFELNLRVPSTDETPLTITAIASDTAGNRTMSAPLMLDVDPDNTAPRVVRTKPSALQILGNPERLTVFFSEPIAPESLMGALSLTGTGPDEQLGSADDFMVTLGESRYFPALQMLEVDLLGPVPAGLYLAIVAPSVSDLGGNTMASPFRWSFRALGQADRDGDGVPDAMEAALGLDPDNPDTDGNGISDGQEDNDNDGLTNAEEAVMGTDPLNPDSDGDGTLDGAEDRDGDGLSDSAELRAGTSPFHIDTDGDGWPDGVEGAIGTSDSFDRDSLPNLLLIGSPLISVVNPAAMPLDNSPASLSVGSVPANVILPGEERIEDSPASQAFGGVPVIVDFE